MKYSLIFFLFSTITFGQVDNMNVLQSPKNKIFLFGESHFVKEKYDEMKSFVFERLDTVSSGEKITMFFELPTSLNYALNRIKKYQDTTVFNEFFNHLYKKKEEIPSYFWTDYKDFIIALLQYSKSKGIELELRCIDVELEFRRTAFILSSFENKLNKKIDSLLNSEYIKNDTVTRSFLLKYVNKLSRITKDPDELVILNKLKSALLIDCTICLNRDQFMYDNFIEQYDTTDAMTFGTFGLDHVVNKPDFTAINEFFKMNYKVDTVGHRSLYNLLKMNFKDQIFRIGIIAFYQKIETSSMQKRKNYNEIMTKDEHDYIEMLLENKTVERFYPSKHEELNNLSSNIDYLIVYKSSNFRW